VSRKRNRDRNDERVTALKSTAVFDLPVGAEGKREAPTEFRVFPAGPFSTTKGIFMFTARSAADVMNAYAGRALPLMGDYEHQTDAESMGFAPMQAPASITEMTPEVRPNEHGQAELWVKDVKWTDRARAYLEAGEYRLFSPVFGHTPEGEITSLQRIALTNKPAMDGLMPLVAATQSDEDEDEETEMETCAKCQAMATELSEVKARLTALTDENTKLTAKLVSFDQWAQEEKKEHEQLTALTGQTDKTAILGAVTKAVADSKELVSLKAKVESERVAHLTAEYNSAATKAVADGRLPPAVKDTCDGIAKTDGIEKAMAFLTAFVGTDAAPAGARVTVLTDSKREPTGAVVLNELEIKFCHDSGISPEVFIKGKPRA